MENWKRKYDNDFCNGAARPARSNARTHTSSASVLSSPPEIPSTTVFACVCSTRFFRPCDWMRRIASARARSCSSYGGTNGLGATALRPICGRNVHTVSV